MWIAENVDYKIGVVAKNLSLKFYAANYYQAKCLI